MDINSVCKEFIQAKSLSKSPNTIRDYQLTMRRAVDFFGVDRDFLTITPSDVRNFLTTIPGCQKNVSNACIGLSSLYTWAIKEGITKTHIMRQIEIPKPDYRIISPFTEIEVKQLLDYNYQYSNFKFRNRAIILTLLDTGVRASELCGIEFAAIRESYVRIFGKGRKERGVPISDHVMKALLDYLQARSISKNLQVQQQRFLFVGRKGEQMSRGSLLQMIHKLGVHVGIKDAHPHRFRHTFAVNYLINGGDPYTLQRILGHTTMEMVNRYLQFSQTDIVNVHRRASPVKHWNL